MSEDVARAVGAASPETVTIAGKECTIRPLSIKELAETERECLKQYRRSYLEAYSENLDLLPISDEERRELMLERIEKASQLVLSQLPMKFAHDLRQIKLTDKLEKWVCETSNFNPPAGMQVDIKEKTIRRLVVAALDAGLLSSEKYLELAGEAVTKYSVPYVNWWITGCYAGMIALVYASVKDYGVTQDEVARELGNNTALLVQLSREIEHLSAPAVGNG